MLARARFSQEWIDALPSAPAGKRVTYHDTEAPSLKLRVTATGAKSFYFVHRVRNGPMEWIHLGPLKTDTERAKNAVTLRDARNKAREYAGEVAKHHNPNESRRARKAEPTLGDFFSIFLAQRRNRRGKPATRLASIPATWRSTTTRTSPAGRRRPSQRSVISSASSSRNGATAAASLSPTRPSWTTRATSTAT